MTKRAVAILVFSFLCVIAKAQPGKEAWHWQFGYGVSLDFSSGSPVTGFSAIDQFEGSASISDPNTGQLLFYTDGMYVWNRNNNQMPNGFGLMGDYSSTQSALIVPKPGSSTLFYIITTPAFGGAFGSTTGAYYSLVDMSLNGGLGDIVTSSKNTVLTAGYVTEKLTAVKQCNGSSYWIIDHTFNSNQFNAYLVNSSGISATPVISNVGTIQSATSDYNAVGYLKASPNGEKLAQGIDAMGILEILDFNPSTGIVSNPIIINYPVSSMGSVYEGPYGLSFSPDNSKLYTCYENAGNIYQWDLSSGVASTIAASKVIIGNGISAGSLALGPDGKIYKSEYGTYYLSVINNPNGLGTACNFQSQAITLPEEAQFGLPNFIDANGSGTVINTSNAVQCTTFNADTLNAGSGFITYQWSNGASTQTIVINNPGTYWVTVSNSTGCKITDTIKAYTIDPGSLHVLKDTVVCTAAASYAANATYNGATGYQWYDGSTNPIKNINASGTYSVNIFFPGGCVVQNTFSLTLNIKPLVNIGRDTILCNNITTPIVLNAGSGSGYTYHWSTGASTQSISVVTGGTYWVQVSTASGCSATDSIKILVVNSGAYQTFDTSLCFASSLPIMLHAPSIPGSNNSYYWSSGGSGTTTYAYYAGTYFLTVYVNGGVCTITDEYRIFLDTARPHIKDIVNCAPFKPDTITGGFGYASYLWSNGATTYTTVINSPGTYWVKVTSFGGCISAADTFKASVIDPADVHVLRDTVICSNSLYYIANAYFNGAQSYQWYDGSTWPTHYFSISGNYWVNLYFSGGCVVKDHFHLTLNQEPYVYLGNDEAICGPLTTPVVLDAGFGFPHYQWSTGSSAEGIYVYSSGIYWVTVTAANGCTATDSIDIQVYPFGNTTKVIDTVICNKTPPFLISNGVPGYNYTYWSNGSTGQTDYIYNSGTYYATVYVGGSSNCIVTDTFHISTGSITKPVIPNIFECNTTVPDVLDAGTGYTNYYWSTGETTESISVNTSGNYMVTVSNSQGCKITDTVKVSYSNSPKIRVLKDTSICNQTAFTADASYPGTISYAWNDGYNYPIHTIGIGSYWVTYTLNTTCIASDSFNVSIKQVKYIDTLPNIVTPNNDGINDVIDFGVYLFPNLQLEIYDRWGKKIFESNDPKCIWSPTCDDGTYFYVAAYSADCDVNQTTKKIKGFFTILK